MFVSRIMAVAAAVVAIAPAAVSAAPASDPNVITRQVSVRTDDINLATQAGQTKLRHRLYSAVTQVCGVNEGDNFDSGRCRAVAYSNAKAQAAAAIADAQPRYADAKVAPAPAPTHTASGS